MGPAEATSLYSESLSDSWVLAGIGILGSVKMMLFEEALRI